MATETTNPAATSQRGVRNMKKEQAKFKVGQVVQFFWGTQYLKGAIRKVRAEGCEIVTLTGAYYIQNKDILTR